MDNDKETIEKLLKVMRTTAVEIQMILPYLDSKWKKSFEAIHQMNMKAIKEAQ